MASQLALEELRQISTGNIRGGTRKGPVHGHRTQEHLVVPLYLPPGFTPLANYPPVPLV